MKSIYLAYLAILPALHAAVIERDVVVYGGTSGAVTAAVQVKRLGKSVILISPTAHLGGMTSSGLGWTDLGNSSILGGLAKEFYQGVYNHYQTPTAWNWQTQASYGNAGQGGAAFNAATGVASVFEPKVAESVFNALLSKAGVEVTTGLLDLTPAGITKLNGKIRSLKLEDGREYGGKMFIDASYEGDLLPGAGVAFTVGREANATYSETFSGIQAARATKNQLPGNIDPYVVAGNAASGLLPGVAADAGGLDGAGDGKLQAYCFRMVLTDVAANRVMVSQPPGYQEADYELLFRAIEAGQTGGFFKLDLMPNRKTDSNNSGGISTDYIGKNYGPGWNWTTLNHAQRAALAKAHENWQRGLLWTLQNHARVPVAIRNAYANWGLPADEFTDNGNWPCQLYVREARRMVSSLVMAQQHAASTTVVTDSVGLAAYSMDSHNVQRHVSSAGFVKNEGDVQMGVSQPYPVSYRSLVPLEAQCGNLLVPWSISSTHMAFGSIRMEPVFMTLAQSAAIAAVLAIDADTNVQQVPYSSLRPALLAAGQALGASAANQPDIIVDNTDLSAVTISAGWVSSSSSTGYVGSDYLHDGFTGQGTKDVVYRFPNGTAGQYHVWLSWTANVNRASNAKVEIMHREGTRALTVDQRNNGSIWYYAATLQFQGLASEGIRISNTGANGFVIADAVGLSPVSLTADSDSDTITDLHEVELGLNPFVADTALLANLRAHPDILGLHGPGEIYEATVHPPMLMPGYQFRLDYTPGGTAVRTMSLTGPRQYYRAAVRTTPSKLLQNLTAGQAQKIVTYGTSLTAGGVWVADLTNWLAGKFPGLVTVVNSGLSGKSSVTGLAQLATKVLAHQPNTVFIEFAVNDAFRYTDGTPQLSPAQAKANLNTMIDRILAQSPTTEIILQTMNPAWDSPTGSNASGTLRPDLALFYAAYREAAAERNLLLLDHFQQWSALQTSNLSTFQNAVPDGVHPTAAAVKQYVEPLMKWKLTGGAE